MAQKISSLPGIGEICLQKRKGSRSIRLSIGHEGEIKVSMPVWTPYKVGEAFVISKTDWIKKQLLSKQKRIFEPTARIGKNHRLHFIHESRRNSNVTSRVTNTEIIIKLPLSMDFTAYEVQAAVRKAAVRALKKEANSLLPVRLQTLASLHSFSYKSVTIKHLKTRWGSCSSQKDIALNCFLMQLPWDLIDYVLLHELLHTEIMAHGPQFWSKLDQYVTNLPAKRKAMRLHQPAVVAAL